MLNYKCEVSNHHDPYAVGIKKSMLTHAINPNSGVSISIMVDIIIMYV